MNIIITTFTNPFSFFCLKEQDGKNSSSLEMENIIDTGNVFKNKIELTDVAHGQYVAVMWKNKWTRGLVTMETQFLIWLIDYGLYLRPNEKTVYVHLPAAHKKYPSKVFEASLHGVVPVDKTLTDECQIQNKIAHMWNAGSTEKAQTLIATAHRIYFVPIALMTTKHNDVVLGDLYLEYRDRGIVNIVDELELWPVFLEKNKAAYIENLPNYYTSRRKHRGCLLKPAIADSGSELPTMTLETSYINYRAICEAAPQLELKQYQSGSEDGSTVLEYTGKSSKDQNMYKLTPLEIEEYANMYINICGREYNVLNVLTNKARDLSICEKYKDHDLKSVGRASYKSSPNNVKSNRSV